jgi:hypothetical protein
MRRRAWLVAVVVVGISLGMTVLPAGAQLPVPTPTVPTPTVPTPPPVPTPTVPTPPPVPKPPAVPIPPPVPTPPPSTSVPSVSVPSVTTPSVRTPAGTVPSTSTPSVSTPSVGAPSASTPSSRTPGGATTRAGSGSSGSGSTGSGGGSGGSAPGASGTAGSTPGGATSPSSGTTGADGQSTRSGSSNGNPESRAARVQRRERALRETVLRFRGCLSRVPRSERRVLSLRAGVGRLRPHTRSQVARITHLERARVIKLERRGLRRLRELNRAGACLDAGATTNAVVAAPGTGTSVPPASVPGDRGGVLAEHHSSGASHDNGSQRKPEQAELSISRPSPGGAGGGSFDLALVLAPLAFLAFLLVITREVRRAG